MRRQRLLRIFLPILGIALLLGLWQALYDLSIFNNALFSSPKDIILGLGSIENLGSHIFSSIYRLFVAVIAGYLLGFITGMLISRYARFSFLEDVVTFFMSIPGISWAPLFIILWGFGDRTIITVGVISAFFPVIYNVIHGRREIDKDLLRVADLFGYTPFKRLLKVEIPALMNYLLVALKLSLARTWRTIIAVEMVAASLLGLGYMIFDARELLNIDVMFTGILLSGLLFYLIELAIVHTLEQRTVIRWGVKKREG